MILAGGVLGVMAAPAGAQGAAPRGTLAVVNGKDGTISLVDLGTRTITATIPVGIAPREVAVSPDGRWAIVSNYGAQRAPGSTLSLIDLASGGLERTISLGAHRRPHGLAWLTNDTLLVTTEEDSALLMVDVTAGQVAAVVHVGQGAPYLVAPSADGKRAYVTNVTSSSVSVVDVAARRALSSTVVAKSADGLALRPAGDELWVTSPQSDKITVLGAGDLAPRATIASGDYPVRVGFTPDGAQALAVFAKSSELKVYDAATRKEAAAITMKVSIAAMHGTANAEGYENHTVPLGIAVSPDGGWAFVTLGGVDALAIVSLRTREIAAVVFVGREPDGVAYSPLVRAPAE